MPRAAAGADPSNTRWPREPPDAVHAYRAYVASVAGPKEVQDLDGVAIGSTWSFGES